MKKIFITLAFAALAFTSSFTARAIEDPEPKGTVIASVVAGPKLVFGVSGGLTGGKLRASVGPGIFLQGDYVLVDSWWMGHFCIGATAGGYILPKITLDDGYESRSCIIIAPRVTYGLNLFPGFEVHAGFNAGPDIFTDQVTYSTGAKKYERPTSLGFDWGFLAGARYYFSRSLGACAELNTLGCAPLLSIGLSYKF